MRDDVVRAEGARSARPTSSEARLADASTRDLASLKWYTVKRGETLATIARKLRVSRTDLAEANYLKVTSRASPPARS